jgi:hypothetical protein
MPDRNMIYIHTNIAEKHIVYHGIAFYDFVRFLRKPADKLLLIKHNYIGGFWHARSGFLYVKDEEIYELAAEDISSCGDFCWLDFEDEMALDELSRQDIAELLYFGHKGEPFASPFFPKLGNSVASWTHDDGWYNSVYFSEPDDFLPVLSNAVLACADTKGRFVKELPLDTAKKLFALSEGGLLIDGSDAVLSKDKAELPFYIIGQIKDFDDMLSNAEIYKDTAAKKGLLRFSIKADPSRRP